METERKPATCYLKLREKKELGQVLGKALRNKSQYCFFIYLGSNNLSNAVFHNCVHYSFNGVFFLVRREQIL